MQRFIQSLVFFCVFLLSDAADHCCAIIYDWPDVANSLQDGFERSLNIMLPPFTLKTYPEVRELGRSDGDQNDDPNASAIVLFSNDYTGFDAEGYYHLIQEEAVRVLTHQGASDYRLVRLNYDLPYDRTRILNAYVIHPDGSVEPVTESHIRDVSNSEDMEVNIFEPIWRSIVISFPGVKPGCIVYWSYENVSVQPRTPGSFQWGHTFRSALPIRSASIQLMGPTSFPIDWSIANQDNLDVTFLQSQPTEDMTLYKWFTGPASMINPEPFSVPMQELTTSLYVSTDTWITFSARESAFIEPNLIPDDSIRRKVIELTELLDDPEEKLKALFRYVTNKVRYMGVTFGDRPGVNPDPVTRTFANNAGVCKDKAGLLTAMLRLAGIEAYYTLNNPELRIHKDVAVDQFNHAIVSARLPGEQEWRYLDVTVDLANSMIPASSGGTQVLRIAKGGAPLETIPEFSAKSNTSDFVFETVLNQDGSLESAVHYSGEGAGDHVYRESFYYMDPSVWSSFFSYWISNLSLDSYVQSWSVTPDNLEDIAHPLEINLAFTASDYAVKAGQYLLFRMPAAQSPFDWFYSDVSEMAALNERTNPASLQIATTTTSRETLRLPDGYKIVATPAAVHIQSASLSFEQIWSNKDGQLILDQSFTVHQSRITTADYSEFRQIFGRIRQAMQTYVILEKSE